MPEEDAFACASRVPSDQDAAESATRLPAATTSDCSVIVQERPSPDWDAFVTAAAEASLYHLHGWAEIASQVFSHRALYIEARDRSGSLAGIMPVVQHRSLLLGNFATSLAFFNYGGVIAREPAVAHQVMTRAAEVAERLGCRYLEFRDTQPRTGDWALRTDKITLQLELPERFEILARSLGSKLRSQVKRAEREPLRVRTGTGDLLHDFYSVFSENMRDLGTPVYPKAFFEAILQRYETHCSLVVIDWRGEPSAAAFLVFWRQRAEVPWAACRARSKPFGLNMKLYWELLEIAVRRGCRSFDFGRSTVGTGTDRFKRQWGAQPVPLYWYRWQRRPGSNAAPAGEDRGRGLSMATAIWQRMPLSLANTLGPLISGALPW